MRLVDWSSPLTGPPASRSMLHAGCEAEVRRWIATAEELAELVVRLGGDPRPITRASR